MPEQLRQVGYVVEGTAFIDPALVSVPLESEYLIGRLDRASYEQEFQYVRKEEYERIRSEVIQKMR
jgi:hypothetical protein